jgi:RNA polymerase sigma factor (sigma-70 family)
MHVNGHASETVCAQSGGGAFVTTHWTEVARAGQTTSPQSLAALEQLCRQYWYPLYAYVRRQGHPHEDAQDLTQEFFARLLERKSLRLADRNRGRFRTFLLTSLKHFLINDRHKANRQKRGGGLRVISLDAEQTETRFQAEPADRYSPDKAFDRHWAMVLLERVLDQLEDEFTAGRRGEVFGALKPFLTMEQGQSSYAELGAKFGLTEASLKVTVHRLRRRYRELFREEIGRTLDDPQAIDEEMQELFAALSD